LRARHKKFCGLFYNWTSRPYLLFPIITNKNFYFNLRSQETKKLHWYGVFLFTFTPR